MIPPASTGRESSSRIAVIHTAIVNSVTGDSRFISFVVFLGIKVTDCWAFSPVTIKLRAPRIDEIPAR